MYIQCGKQVRLINAGNHIHESTVDTCELIVGCLAKPNQFDVVVACE
jgi:hypothetical protein